jgi:hypothetical protein
MAADIISPELKTVLRRLKLGRMLDTLPERLTLARQQKMSHQDFLLLVLSDEASRRDSQALTLRAERAQLDPAMQLEAWDTTAKVTFDRAMLNELVSLRFLEARQHVAIVGPVGVGKTFLAHALGHIACRRGASVLALRSDRMLKSLKHARLDNSYEAELRKLLATELLIIDREPRYLRHPDRAASSRVDRRHLQPRSRRVARHLRRSRARTERHRSLHLQLLRPGHGGRVLSPAAEALDSEGEQGGEVSRPQKTSMLPCVGRILPSRENRSWAILERRCRPPPLFHPHADVSLKGRRLRRLKGQDQREDKIEPRGFWDIESGQSMKS